MKPRFFNGYALSKAIVRKPTEKGESIEEMLRRAIEDGTPIDATAPMTYTEQKDGVLPQYDFRTDRFDLALDAIEKTDKSVIASAGEKPEVEPTKTNDNESK